MRPNKFESASDLYECFSCGRRAGETEVQICGGCGGQLQNISRSRDL
ncbi:MAG: rubrerythrin-like domain-containing protein [Natronomonas sp.]